VWLPEWICVWPFFVWSVLCRLAPRRERIISSPYLRSPARVVCPPASPLCAVIVLYFIGSAVVLRYLKKNKHKRETAFVSVRVRPGISIAVPGRVV
jgi:hypothetical protein